MDDVQDPAKVLTKDELNLAEFPFALVSHRPPKAAHVIEISEAGVDRQGRPIQRKWTVQPSAFGLPLPIDEEVFLGLIHFLYRSEFRERHVYFTQHRLFQLLGWSGNRRDYARLELSLRRLKGSLIECKESFWDVKGKCFATHGFSLVDSYSLYRRDISSTDQPFISRVSFNETIFESMRSGFIKTLDLNLYLSLKSPLARRLFRLLDKKLYKGETYEIELMRLASRLALTDSAYPSTIRKQLDRSAHAELRAMGFLRDVRYIRRGKSTSVQYHIAPKQTWHFPIATTTSKGLAGEDPLVRELVTRGVTRSVARVLLETYGDKRIADKLEVFDHLQATSSPLLTKNPAGFLRTSIEKDFAPPTGYISRAERQRRKEEEIAAHKRQRELAESAEKAERARQEKFESLWSSFSDNERVQFEQEVLATLNTFTLHAYRKEKADGRSGPAHATVRTEIAKLLERRRGLIIAAQTDPVRDLA